MLLVLMLILFGGRLAHASSYKTELPSHIQLRQHTLVANQDTISMYVTFYGWPDNSPPGAAIAYPVIHSQAGGTGTYNDPVTFATDQNEFPPGTIVYVPFLSKYFIMEDDCAQCDSDWENSQSYHIDLWTGGDGSNADQQIQCEDFLTHNSADVIVNPPSDLSVDTTPLFDPNTGACYQP